MTSSDVIIYYTTVGPETFFTIRMLLVSKMLKLSHLRHQQEPSVRCCCGVFLIMWLVTRTHTHTYRQTDLV